MFSSPSVKLHIAKANLKTGTNDKNEVTREAEIAFVLEPFTPDLAHELGESIADHLFDGDELRDELDGATLNPRVPNQAVTVAADPQAQVVLATLRYVGFGPLKIAKQVNEKNGQEWFKATIMARLDLSPRLHREWLVANFGDVRYFSFEAEQGELLDSGVQQAVRNLQDLAKGDGISSMEITTRDGDREIGTRITKDNVESIDRPPKAKGRKAVR